MLFVAAILLLCPFVAGHKMFENAPPYLRHELTAPFYTHIFNSDVYNQRSSAVDLNGCTTMECFRSRLTVRMLHYFIQETTLNEEETQVANAPLVNVLSMKQVVARYRSNTVIVGRVLMILGEEYHTQVLRQIAIYEAATQCLDIEGFAPTPNHRLEFLHSLMQLLSELYTVSEHGRELIYVTSRLLDDQLWLTRANDTTKYLITHRLASALLNQGHASSVIDLVASWLRESVVRNKQSISSMLLLQGQAYAHLKNYSIAEDTFRNALQFHASTEAEALLGKCLYMQEKWSEAAAILESALPSPVDDTCSPHDVELIKMTMEAFHRTAEVFLNEGNTELEELARQRLDKLQKMYAPTLAAAEPVKLNHHTVTSTSPKIDSSSLIGLVLSLLIGAVVLGIFLVRRSSDTRPRVPSEPPAPSE